MYLCLKKLIDSSTSECGVRSPSGVRTILNKHTCAGGCCPLEGRVEVKVYQLRWVRTDCPSSSPGAWAARAFAFVPAVAQVGGSLSDADSGRGGLELEVNAGTSASGFDRRLAVRGNSESSLRPKP